MALNSEALTHYYKASLGETYDGNKRREARKRPLPTLSAMVDAINIFSTVDLGIREIRLNRIKGTYYDSRNSVFYDDFIPKNKPKSEFGMKWVALCSAQMNEGIRDPILVYEYLNNYYVQEGNKRVSVLKYFDAVSIHAKVIRLIPPYDETNQEVMNYYSFLDFYEKTDYEDIWFTKAERFQEMIELMDQYEEKESYLDYLRGPFAVFRRNYKLQLEERYSEDVADLTTGDIYLAYCKMFGEDELDELSLKKRLGEVIRQCIVDSTIEVIDTVDVAFADKPMMAGLLRKPKVAFVFPFDNQKNGWAKDHWRGQQAMKEAYAGQMTVDTVESLLEVENPMEVMNKAAEDYDVLFIIDSVLSGYAEQSAVDHPKTTFLICTGIKTSYLTPSYYGKTYQTNFLLGMYGAMIAEHDRVGYVSKDMNPTIFRSMRAFEDGFKSIRPSAKIYYAKEERELDSDIMLSAYYRSVVVSHMAEGTVNTYLKQRNEKVYKAYTYWEWKKFYQGIFERLADGSFTRLRNANKAASNALFFLWGLDTEVIGIRINDSMPSPSAAMIFHRIKEDIIDGRFDLTYLRDISEYEQWCELNRSGECL